VHEEETVARDMPDLRAAIQKTMLDHSPFGAQHSTAHGAAPDPGAIRSIPTPMVPAEITPDAMATAQRKAASTTALGATLMDPTAAALAQGMREAALAQAQAQQQESPPPAEPAAPAERPKANLMKTMLMGESAVAAPHMGGGPAPSQADRPTAQHLAQHAPQPAAAAEPPRAAGGDASPLSRSVMAPGSWKPPPPDAAQNVHPAPTAGVAPEAPGASKPPLRTMLGMPATDLPTSGAPPAAMPHPAAAPVQSAAQGPMSGQGQPAPAINPNLMQSGALAPAQRTMLGVAIPGIAPTGGAAGAPGPQVDPRNLASKQGTMLGVAIPGIAPTHSHTAEMPMPQAAVLAAQAGRPMPSQVQHTALGIAAPVLPPVVPAPAPLHDEPLPEAPIVQKKGGVPALAVVGILIVLVVVLGGVGAFFALRGGAPITAAPQLDETGRESLKITCPSCPDGTVVALGASSATVSASAAVLPLPAPLSIGENELAVKIDRPAAGRDEEVKVHVPVAYRVRADLSTLASKPPAITVRVEAAPGTEVAIESKPLALDAQGKGFYAIDLSKETEGTGDSKTFERKIPFTITPKNGKAEPGELTARTAILPLAIDAPGLRLFTDKGSAAVIGQTKPGSTLTIDGATAPVDAKGAFGVRVELPASGEKTLEIMASAPPLAPRIVKAKVIRVATLAEAAKALDAESPVKYDAFGADPASKTNQNAVVEGEVVDARATAGHTVLLVEERKACAKGASCLVRVELGEDNKIARGDVVKAYGRIVGAVTASGKTVPDLEAALVMPTKK